MADAETTINVLNALQGQQAQLKRLIAQKMWISAAPKATLTEMDAQVTQIKTLLAEIEKDIQDQLKRIAKSQKAPRAKNTRP